LVEICILKSRFFTYNPSTLYHFLTPWVNTMG
jgi:hypothetical protein